MKFEIEIHDREVKWVIDALRQASSLVSGSQLRSEDGYGTHFTGRFDCGRLAGQLEAQLPKPRIPEPGLWGVVEASISGSPEIRAWVRGIDWWVRLSDGAGIGWRHLLDPTLIRDGIES